MAAHHPVSMGQDPYSAAKSHQFPPGGPVVHGFLPTGPVGPPGMPGGPGVMGQQKRLDPSFIPNASMAAHHPVSIGQDPNSITKTHQFTPGGPVGLGFPPTGPVGPSGMLDGSGAMNQQKRLEPNFKPNVQVAQYPVSNGQEPYSAANTHQFPPPGPVTHGFPPTGPVGPPAMLRAPGVMSQQTRLDSNLAPNAPTTARHPVPPGQGPYAAAKTHQFPPGGGPAAHGFPPTGPVGPPVMPGVPGVVSQQQRLDPSMMPTAPMATYNPASMGQDPYSTQNAHQFPPGGPVAHGFPPTGPIGPPGMPGGPGAVGQQKRLDPNLMPSAVQVIEDDRKAHAGVFRTGYPRAELPPLVTTDFISEDQGNCNPKFIRSTLYGGPVNSDLLKQSAIPFALTISPIARLDPQERPLPIIDMGELGPVRCHRCKAYMCPYMEFNFGGRRFFCPFCKANTDVPTEYFAHLDQNGQRTDICERPELCLASYEFIATKEYCKHNVYPKSPAFIFMLDVSYNAVRTGVMKLFCENIKHILRNLPKEANADKSDIKVGFVTYDQTVHFYSLKSSLGQPKMLIINDVQDTFVPIVDGFLVDLHEAESTVDVLLSQIPLMFSESKITEIVLGPVVQAGMDALKAADQAGKLFIFHSSLPTFEAPGKLKNRDDKQIIGTDKEKTVLLPQNEFYTKLAQDCVSVGCCVDVFLFPNAYIDVATIGTMCGLTGGQLYKYQYFQPEIDGHRFLNDLRRNIERPVVFDAIMRVRTSTGIRPTDFFGNIYMQNTTDIELAALDCDKSITVEIKHDDKIEDQSVFFQVALLFTSMHGQRKLRIHNLSLNVSTDLASLYRSADLFSVLTYLTKQGERLLFQKSAREVRENLVSRTAQILATYRQHCSPSSSLGQLVLPETMKLLPLMTNCVMKNSAFIGGADMSFDDRAWLMQNIPAMTLFDVVCYFYPRIIPVHEIIEDLGDELPTAVRCAYENLSPSGAYLFDNSVVVLFWIGNQVSNQWIQDVFDVQSFAQISSDKHTLLERDNNTSRFVRRIFDKMQANRTRCMKLYIIKQQDKLEPWFKKFMVEDRGTDGSPSYVEFLCHIHKEIRNILS